MDYFMYGGIQQHYFRKKKSKCHLGTFSVHSEIVVTLAISCLKRALWISPTNWRVLFNLGLVHLSTFQPASAFNFLCAAVNLRSDVPHSFTGLGCALLELKDVENAGRAFRQGLTLAPDDPLIIVNNVLSLILLDRKEAALDLFKKFNALLEENAAMSQDVLTLAGKLAMILEQLSQKKVGENNLSSEINAEIDGDNKTSENIAGEMDESPLADLSPREMGPDEV